METLARWYDPVRGPIPPVRFIPVAEASGLVHALGRTVLSRACHDIAALNRDLGLQLLVTVNACGRELVQPDYCEQVMAALADSGLPADRLVIEVTESSADVSSTGTRRTLQVLRDIGVHVAIDDFGTGFSAFSQLDTVPADYLKLDSAFTAQIVHSPRRRAMLAGLLDLSSALGLTVVVEGVEDPDQAAQLHLQGCTLAQGFHFGRPTTVADLRVSLDTCPTEPGEIRPGGDQPASPNTGRNRGSVSAGRSARNAAMS